MSAKKEYFYALGRRKSATARARLYKGKGDITINNKPFNEYFDASEALAQTIIEPIKLLEKDGQYDISILVSGGGHAGQAEAIRLAITKSLVVLNEDYKPTLKKADMLSRDPRDKERKKFGLKGARKKRQFTKR